MVTRNKARLVAQVFTQIEGLDFGETYAPVARLKSIRILLAYATHHDLNEEGKAADQKVYRSMIGSLLYLYASMPDIMLSVCMCVRFQANPKEYHFMAVKRILRYLVFTPNLGLWYSKGSSFGLCQLQSRSKEHYGDLSISWPILDRMEL